MRALLGREQGCDAVSECADPFRGLRSVTDGEAEPVVARDATKQRYVLVREAEGLAVQGERGDARECRILPTHELATVPQHFGPFLGRQRAVDCLGGCHGAESNTVRKVPQ